MPPTGLLDPGRALLAVIDIQENHYPTVFDGDDTLHRLTRFVRACRLLEIPVVWTEHHPRAFGPTLPALVEALDGFSPIPKKSFGCFGEPRFREAVAETGRHHLVLVGSETSICIQQTALAALDQGLEVVAVADCLTARHRLDHELALTRIREAGGVITTWEALVYEWMRDAHHPAFRAVLALVKDTFSRR